MLKNTGNQLPIYRHLLACFSQHGRELNMLQRHMYPGCAAKPKIQFMEVNNVCN